MKAGSGFSYPREKHGSRAAPTPVKVFIGSNAILSSLSFDESRHPSRGAHGCTAKALPSIQLLPSSERATKVRGQSCAYDDFVSALRVLPCIAYLRALRTTFRYGTRRRIGVNSG